MAATGSKDSQNINLWRLPVIPAYHSAVFFPVSGEVSLRGRNHMTPERVTRRVRMRHAPSGEGEQKRCR